MTTERRSAWLVSAVFVLLTGCIGGQPSEVIDSGDGGGVEDGGRDDVEDEEDAAEGGDARTMVSAEAGSSTRPADGGAFVFQELFETATPSGTLTNFEVADGAKREGAFGLRPRQLPAGGSAEYTFSCGGHSHTMLEFKYYMTAELIVDGARYGQLAETGGAGWATRQIVLPPGEHTYTWKVTTVNAGRPPFLLDSLKCTSVEPVSNTTGAWGFDEGFAPLEFTGFDGPAASRWQINNEAQREGGLGVRPPLLAAGAGSELTTRCGGRSHTMLEFKYYMTAELIVDGIKEELPNSGGAGWATRHIVLPPGEHTYTWSVNSTNAERPPFLLDSIRCSGP